MFDGSIQRRRGHQPKRCYEAGPFMRRDVAAWMVFDTRTGRLVAKPLHMNAALMLAHTLNVADLTEPMTDYGAARKG
jgi:hypothetical protein